MIHTSITLISQTKSNDDLLRKTGDTTNQTTSVTLIITMSTQRRRPKRKTDNIEQMSYYHRHQLPDETTQGKQVTNPNKPNMNNSKGHANNLITTLSQTHKSSP